jgi:hypothetical protein
MLVVGSHFPAWWPFLVTSYARSHPTYELIVVHTGEPPATASAQPHVRYERIGLPALAVRATPATRARPPPGRARRRRHGAPAPILRPQARFVEKLGVSRRRVDDKFASAKGLSDLKPFYGHIFDDLIDERRYTHWGWADWDLLIGDLPCAAAAPARTADSRRARPPRPLAALARRASSRFRPLTAGLGVRRAGP